MHHCGDVRHHDYKLSWRPASAEKSLGAGSPSAGSQDYAAGIISSDLLACSIKIINQSASLTEPNGRQARVTEVDDLPMGGAI